MPREPAPPVAPARATRRGANPRSLARSPLGGGARRPEGRFPQLSRTVRGFLFLTRSRFPLTPRCLSPLSPRGQLSQLLRGPVAAAFLSHPNPRPSWKFLSSVTPFLLRRLSASSFPAAPHPGNLLRPGVPNRSQLFLSTPEPSECGGANPVRGPVSAPPNPWCDSEASTPAAFSSCDSARAGSGPGDPSLRRVPRER